jgi:hypothetical protein
MKSTWIFADVHPLVRLAVERSTEAHAVRDVTRRVLVEQRVVEERPGLADARLLRHERELAEPVGVLDRRELAADESPRRSRPRPDDSPVLERELESADDLPSRQSGSVERIVPSARRESGVVKISSVGMFAT